MNLNSKKSTVALAIAAAIGISAGTLTTAVSAATLADGFYNMTINNTPYTTGPGYGFGTDGAWNSSFTFSCKPGTKGCGSNAMYDDLAASPVNGKYSGVANDGVSGTVAIKVEGGVITGTGLFQFDTIGGTAGGDFAQYGGSSSFTGSIDGSGNISLTPTGTLATVGDFPSLVDEAWNVDNFNGGSGAGTNFVPNSPNSNTGYDAFSTGSATNASGTINGAAYDGTKAILVKGGSIGNSWGGFFGAQYFEVWNVGFTFTAALPTTPAVPVPAAAWLLGSGLVGLVGVARRRKSKV
jgi:hypothetical protein